MINYFRLQLVVIFSVVFLMGCSDSDSETSNRASGNAVCITVTTSGGSTATLMNSCEEELVVGILNSDYEVQIYQVGANSSASVSFSGLNAIEACPIPLTPMFEVKDEENNVIETYCE